MVEKILIIQTAFPGDAILTLPFIQKLFEVNDNPVIDVVCIPSTEEIFSASPYINKVFVLDKKHKHKSILSTIAFAKELREEKYTKLYSPHRSLRTSLIVYFSKIKNTTGYDAASFSFVYKNKINYRSDIHEVARNLSFLEKEIKNWKILPEVKIDIQSVEKVDKYLKQFNNKRLAAVAPGSVWNTKIYPEEYYINIIENLVQKDFSILLIGGKSDTELCERIAGKFDNSVISSAGKFSITESIELLHNCEILVCNDSAPTHMAMCADIPVITIYCSTVPSFGFYPYNKKSTTVSFDELDCKPCGIHGHKQCPIKTFDCGKKLLPEKVIEKIEEIIS